MIIVIAILTSALVGCDQKSDTEASDAMHAPIDTSGFSAPVTNGPGQTFADIVAASDRFEIEASKLAVVKASSSRIKAFAQEMIKVHTESTAKLTAAASKASPSIKPLPDLTTAQQDALTALKAQPSDAFGTGYVQGQKALHQKALDLPARLFNLG